MRFSNGTIKLKSPHKEYIELKPHNERFLFDQPFMSVHNLIIGSPYLDAEGKGYVRNVKFPNEQYVDMDF